MEKEEFLSSLDVELKISKSSNYTIRNYLFSNKSFLDYTQKTPNEISEHDVKKFLADQFTDKSPSTITLFLAAIRYSFTTLLKKDITQNIKRPKKEKRIPVVLSKQDIKKLINSINNHKSKLMISLIYACGLRVSELVSLKLDDLNFEESSGIIKQSKGKKDRFFNIPTFLEDELQLQVNDQKEKNSQYLFSGPNGKLSPRNLQKIVKVASKKAGLSGDVHCHTLRHSYATHLLENGVDIRKIQELLGHSDLSTTQIYTHISKEELKKVTSPIDNL